MIGGEMDWRGLMKEFGVGYMWVLGKYGEVGE